jgi:hypothetical protein
MSYGAVAGAIYGLYQLVAGNGPEEPVLIYQLIFVVGTALAGVVMFGIAAALRNILVR